MNIIDLRNISVGDTIRDGIVLITSLSLSVTKNQKKYLSTSLHYKGCNVTMKVWDEILALTVAENVQANSLVKISGTVSSYNNIMEIHCTEVDWPDESLNLTQKDFYKSIDIQSCLQKVKDCLNRHCSSETIQIANAILFEQDDVRELFTTGFAGKAYHDAQIGGLLHHSYKMMHLLEAIIDHEPRLATNPKMVDILMLGALLHDIGKIYELTLNAYTDISYVTHRILGAEILFPHKELILKLKGQKFYYDLLSIIAGHHGGIDAELARTVVAYVIHTIDMMESSITNVFDSLDNKSIRKNDNGSKSIYCNGTFLTL